MLDQKDEVGRSNWGPLKYVMVAIYMGIGFSWGDLGSRCGVLDRGVTWSDVFSKGHVL